MSNIFYDIMSYQCRNRQLPDEMRVILLSGLTSGFEQTQPRELNCRVSLQ